MKIGTPSNQHVLNFFNPKWFFIIVIIAIVFGLMCDAKHIHKEKWYQDKYCDGIEEFVLKDKTRVDCLTATHAIEYEFASKWAESIGQALYYSLMTGKKAGIAIILESDSDYKYYNRLKVVADKYGIAVWVIK